MQRVQLDKDIRSLSEFRANVATFIGKVRKTKRPLVITQRGKSAAVVLDVGEYESLIERIELLTDIQIGETQIKQGKGVEHEDAKQQILQRVSK